MGTGTQIGRVRGLGSAKEGAHHWWMQRVTAFGNLLLVLWFVFSLLRMPSYDYAVVSGWLSAPLPAILMALLVVNVCYHFRLGMQVVVEDYLHGGGRIIALGVLHLWTFALGATALYAILKIAITGAAHG